MKLQMIFLALTLALCSHVHAGKQTVQDLTVNKIYIDTQSTQGNTDSVKLIYTGIESKTQKTRDCLNKNAVFTGAVGNVDCSKLYGSCGATKIFLANNEIRLEIYGDIGAVAGSEYLGTITLGTINSDNTLTLDKNRTLKSYFVKETYTFLERMLTGAKNRSFCSLKIN